jgi:glycosyltransferase involved in cell wall biosynthesis
MAKNYLVDSMSVCLPAYNEEKNIESTVKDAVLVLDKVVKSWEVVVVDDGSKDNTGKILKSLNKKEPRIKVVTHNPNRGYGGALKSCLYTAKHDWIIFADSDGQFKFDATYHFLDEAKKHQADMVIGYRLQRQDPASRKLIGLMLKVWNFILYQVWFKDADCGFKLISKKVINGIPKLQTESAITETEFLIRAKRAGFKICETGVRHYPRVEGEQTGGNFKVIFKALRESFLLFKALRSR